MKKFFFALAFVGSLLIGAPHAVFAQCCDAADTDGDPNTPDEQCGQIDPTASATAGCADGGGGNCIGGQVDGPEGPNGCICVGGQCEAGSQSFGDTPGACAMNAAAACCASSMPSGTCN